MKTKLERLISLITDLRDSAQDDEVCDELDNALIHLDAASDRLVAIDEENFDAAADEAEALTQQWAESQEMISPESENDRWDAPEFDRD